MIKDWRDSKFFKIIEEFIISPVGEFSNEYGKFVVTVSIVCLCLFITRPMTETIILPKALEDTVGDIPVIEHWDDGEIEVIEMPMHSHSPSGWGNSMVSGCSIMTGGWSYY